jgi:hypothetical protein
MRSFFIQVIAVLSVFSLNAQTPFSPENMEPYDYDTTLKGGYTISFKADSVEQHLYLKKGGKTIIELSSCATGLLYKNLGYVGADYKDYFVLVHSYGSGNPHYIELIKKRTGENVFKNTVFWIDAIEEKEVLLYCIGGPTSPKDKMILYDIQTGKKQSFNFPVDVLNDSAPSTHIEIGKLTDKLLVIKYDTEKGSKTKSYNR